MSLFQRLARLIAPKPADRAMPIGLGRDMPTLDDLPSASDADRIIHQVCREALAAMQGWQPKLSDSPRWMALKDDAARLQIAVALGACVTRPRGSITYRGDAHQIESLRNTIVSQILRRDLPFSETDLVSFAQSWSRQPYSLEYGLPGRTILGAIERHVARHGLSPAMKAVLYTLRVKADAGSGYDGVNKFYQGVADRIDQLLDPRAKPAALPSGPFGEAFLAGLAPMSPENRAVWVKAGQLAAEAGDKSKPSAKWLAAMKAQTADLEREAAVQYICGLLEETTPDPARLDASLDVLKGLIWAAPGIDPSALAGPVGLFAEKCFRKVSGVGARSVKLGNAALWALSDMAGEPRAAAELFRLRGRIKYPSARKLIDNRLDELAARTGQNVEALEDQSLPDFGLDAHGFASHAFGAAWVELRLGATALDSQWFTGTGKPAKAPPAEVREHHAAELAAFKRLAKDIEAARDAQAKRLEDAWLENRSWSLAEWRANYLGHPLRRPLVSALVWRITDGARTASIMPTGGNLMGLDGAQARFADSARVSLWHPLDSEPAEVLAWRRHLLDHGLTQPIKQAHREIYVLTDAERQTGVYSNRFAAHILRQHQFRALCQARGWAYEFQGGWDSWNMPTRRLPSRSLAVEYQVEPIDDGQRSEAFIPLYLSTDQVRFVDGITGPVELITVPPVVFSEVMRDVDLFVAVTSVANDPNWTDGGPDGRNGQYWQAWAFGELGQSASTRRELIAYLAPKLSIADKLTIGDKALIVQGKRQQYAIHFGSGNIQILPDNRYLCIVPDRPAPEAQGLRLPFTGDGLLSIILSKAFMLVDETQIRDPTILRQL